MELVLIGITMALNIIIILKKFREDRLRDAGIDLSILALITYFCSGTFSALAAGSTASLCISFYLHFRPYDKPKNNAQNRSKFLSKSKG